MLCSFLPESLLVHVELFDDRSLGGLGRQPSKRSDQFLYKFYQKLELYLVEFVQELVTLPPGDFVGVGFEFGQEFRADGQQIAAGQSGDL